MVGMEQAIWPESLGIKKHEKSGTYAVNIMRKRLLDMGLVNTVVPLEQLEAETIQWCEELLDKSPMAHPLLKSSFQCGYRRIAGIQQLAGDATLLYYTSDEAKEGREAFKEKRNPDFKQFPRFP